LIFIIGEHDNVPEKLPEDSVVFVIGYCASEHQNKGNFAVDACAMPEY